MNYRFVIPLLTTALFEQICVSMVRVTTSYRAVELGLSVVWLGVITAAFAILPMAAAVKIGRFVDRGNDARSAWIGGGLQVVACAGLAFSQSLAALLVCTAILGISHLMLVIGLQVLCSRQKGPGAMERMLGNYMVANAIGQGVGPYIVGWAGGSASIPPTQLLFWIGLAAAALTCINASMLRSGQPPMLRTETSKPTPILALARIPGLWVIFFVSVVTVAAQDLIVVYLPVLGAERHMPVDDVGMLLSVRAMASMFSRLLFARLNEWFGRDRLMVVSTFAGAVAYAAIAAPLPLVLLHAAMAAAGFAMGVSITVSIAALLALATPDARGTTNSLRMMGNRMGQLVIPFLAGLLAAATGAAGIFLAIGVSLAGAATVAQLRRPRQARDGDNGADSQG